MNFLIWFEWGIRAEKLLRLWPTMYHLEAIPFYFCIVTSNAEDKILELNYVLLIWQVRKKFVKVEPKGRLWKKLRR